MEMRQQRNERLPGQHHQGLAVVGAQEQRLVVAQPLLDGLEAVAGGSGLHLATAEAGDLDVALEAPAHHARERHPLGIDADLAQEVDELALDPGALVPAELAHQAASRLAAAQTIARCSL